MRITRPRFGYVTWFYIALAIALGFVGPHLNQWFFPWLVSPLDKATLSTILSAIASGMITLTGIVFSLVFVIVQFGSSTYSPRITRIFAHVRALRHSLGVFTGTFVYSLMALRALGVERAETVSALTVWLAFAWLLGSIVVLASLVKVFTTLTIGNVLFALSGAGAESIARTYPTVLSDREHQMPNRSDAPREDARPPIRQTVTFEGEPGHIIGYDRPALVALARHTGSQIELPYAVGAVVRDGQPIALVRGGGPANIPEPLIYAAITLGREREFRNDPGYALRLLADMAIRALSPAINDPTTAAQALEHIAMLLHRLGNADLDTGSVKDEQGILRLLYNVPSWDDFLQLGLTEIAQYGASSPQVQRKLLDVFAYLSRSVPASRVVEVERLGKACRELAINALDEVVLRQWANLWDR